MNEVKNPGSRCSVCRHEKAAEINARLLGRIKGKPFSLRSVAKDYGLTKSSIDRHKAHRSVWGVPVEAFATVPPTPPVSLTPFEMLRQMRAETFAPEPPPSVSLLSL